MPNFNCENKELEGILLELYNLIVKSGGYIHDDVTVFEKGGELSIRSNLPSDNNEEIISIPDSCLPRLDDFNMTVHEDILTAEPKSDYISKSQIIAMSLMLKIYNLTKKLSKYRQIDIWQVLRGYPELMGKIFEARAKAPRIFEYYKKFEKGKFDELLVETFLGSRMLRYKFRNKEKSSLCLMPFIDFVNHNINSPMYQNSAFKSDSLAVINSMPLPDSDECFVRYSILDALDSLVIYGFSDTSTSIVRSIPLNYDFHVYGRIEVNTQISQHYTKSLPDSVQDLYLYMPYILGLERDLMQLSHLIIPGDNAPWALRRVLDYLIKSWKPGLKPAVMKDIVVNFENFVIDKNIEYYKSLSGVIRAIDETDLSADFLHTLNTMIGLQLNKLKSYQDRMSKLG